MDLTVTRSKRRNTLYPQNINKKQTVEVIKHFEPKNGSSSNQSEDLPYVVSDDDESKEGDSSISEDIIEGVTFQLHHYDESSDSTSENKTAKKNKPVQNNSLKKATQNATKNKAPQNLKKSALKKPVTTTKRDVPATTAASNRSKSQQSSPVKSDDKKGANKITHKTTKPCKNCNIIDDINLSPRKIQTGATKNDDVPAFANCRCPYANANKPYSFVNASYIQNLKDEIRSLTYKNRIQIFKAADDLKSEIDEFRNNFVKADVTFTFNTKEPTNLVSTSTDVPSVDNVSIPNTRSQNSTKNVKAVEESLPEYSKWYAPLSPSVENVENKNNPNLTDSKEEEILKSCTKAKVEVNENCICDCKTTKELDCYFDEEPECDLSDEPDWTFPEELVYNSEKEQDWDFDEESDSNCTDKDTDDRTVEEYNRNVENEPEQCPTLPLLIKAVRSPLCLRYSENATEVESHSKTYCPACASLAEDEYFLHLLEEQNKNIKTFSSSLAEAQNILEDITEKVKNSKLKAVLPCIGSKCSKSVQQEEPKSSLPNKKVKQQQFTVSEGIQVASAKKDNEPIGSTEKREYDGVGVQVEKEEDDVSSQVNSVDPSESDRHSLITQISSESRNFSNENVIVYNKNVSDTYLNLKEVADKLPTSENVNYELSTISEKTETSSSSKENKEIVPSPVKTENKMLPVVPSKLKCKICQSKMSKATEDTNEKGVEVNHEKMSKQDLFSKDKDVQTENENTPTNRDTPVKRNLVVQKMPSINIRRGLVTQKIPSIVITANESEPQVSTRSNIVYEEMKHASAESVKIDQCDKNTQSMQTDDKQITSKISVGTGGFEIENDKPCKNGEVSGTAKKLCTCNCDNETHQVKEEETNELLPEHEESIKSDLNTPAVDSLEAVQVIEPATSIDKPCSQKTTYLATGRCLCIKECGSVPARTQTSEIKLSTTEYSQYYDPQCKKALSASDSTAVPGENIGSKETGRSFSQRRSIHDKFASKLPSNVEHLVQCQKERILKEFVSELITKNPDAENVLKSYQLIGDKSAHEPDAKINEEELSYIDTDVYKTFVNPEGLKVAQTTENKETNTSEGEKVTYLDSTSSTKSVKQPCTFVRVVTRQSLAYSTSKSTQFEEVIDVECNDQICGLPLDDNSSVNQEPFKKQEIISEASDSMGEFVLSNNQPVLSLAIKSEDIGVDSQEESYMENLDKNVLQAFTHLSKDYPSTNADNFLNTQSEDSVSYNSNISNTTEDIIFEITAPRTRKAQSQNSSSGSSKSPDRHLYLNQANLSDIDEKSVSLARSQVSEGSEYIITRDISIQTSLVSEQFLSSQKPSDQHTRARKSMLKNVSDTDSSKITCCGNLLWQPKKKKTQNVFLRSSIKKSPQEDSEQTSIFQQVMTRSTRPPSDETPPLHSSSEIHRKSVKIEEPLVPDVLQAYKIRNVNEAPSFSSILVNRMPGKSTLTGSEKSRLSDYDRNEYNKPSGSEYYGNKKMNEMTKQSESDDDITRPVTIMTVNLEQPEIYEKLISNAFITNKNIPRGDGGDYDEKLNICNRLEFENQTDQLLPFNLNNKKITHPPPLLDTNQTDKLAFPVEVNENQTPNKNEKPTEDKSTSATPQKSQTSSYSTDRKNGHHHHHHKHKRNKKRNDTTSSGSTIGGGISDITEEFFSEGEVRCKCNSSIGEVHVCSCLRNIGISSSHVRRHPQRLLAREFGDPNVKIKWQKTYNSNWVAYYVSRSPSPGSYASDTITVSQDSSGLVRK